jgi:hypothetical protein
MVRRMLVPWVLLGLVLVAAPAAYSASSPFTGAWTSVDLDGSTQYLQISGGTELQVGMTDFGAPGTCAGAPISKVRIGFSGTLSGDTLTATIDAARCGSLPLPDLVGLTFDFTYDAASDTLFGIGVTWTRAGS